ncbi:MULTISPECIES: MgtC/SapB family protein [Azorhizobium]|uniref:Protein MgtC n=1 Tax=Azorhizobium caulinodans (strain ATCC 43989 / DSM 5975 / JCM 20966 / LMG 6465 / NBRC 14845 / NCIMB 13405 / ORS 571) TaxID=438753 RepID=A8I5R8_AZOC5|nr:MULTISPECIES: MgtC/SapB family protein [Azorhizobium]TDT99471.1 putative Mg2+ transporter-C (MgtC) family protein [Azorhizobium sp. AG788]BAF88311.1 MgtC/SapB transporter [Azorhizobium caulinodans ORS 571]
MKFIESFHLLPFLDTVVSYVAAFVCGALIGAERQYRQRTAGLRTNVLVAIGAAGFTDLAQGIAGDVEAVRVISYVVSGIGFLGAGVIMKEGLNVRGLNTAATLWCSAAVGACAGVDRLAEAFLLTVFVIAGNTLLRPLVNAINRIPIKAESIEATYTVSLTTAVEQAGVMRDLLEERLEAASYPVAELEVVERGEEQVEIVATLTSTEVEGEELDAVVEGLLTRPHVDHATWSANTQS